MDIERAKALAAEKRTFEQKVKHIEPINSVEGLSPRERYSTLAKRIEEISTDTDSYGGSISHNVELDFEDNLSLRLAAVYNAVGSAYGRIPDLFVIEASWRDGDEYVPNPRLALEQLRADKLNEPDSVRVLGLLEESVTVAEKELERRNKVRNTASQNPQS